MPTNRPFFANFLAAFRAHSALTKPTSTNPSVSNPSQNNTSAAFSSGPSLPRSITTKSPASPAATTTAAVQAANQQHLSQHTRHASTSPPPHPNPRQHTSSSMTRQQPHASSSSSSSSAVTSCPSRSPVPSPQQGWLNRRGSDSSSEGGFREVLGGEKWYVGGRTAGGEERFLRLGMVRRERSWERRSADQMSL